MPVRTSHKECNPGSTPRLTDNHTAHRRWRKLARKKPDRNTSLEKTTLEQRVIAHLLSLHKPHSSDSAIVGGFATAVTREDVADDYHGVVPSRLGHSYLVDIAAACLVEADSYRLGRPGYSWELCLKTHGKALVALKASIATADAAKSDDCLLAVALLGCFELVLGRPQVVAAHVEGLVALAKARDADGTITDFSRSLCLQFSNLQTTFEMDVARGNISAYETPSWLSWIAQHHDQTEAARLHRVFCELTIRMPRLVQLIRTIRSGSGDAETVLMATVLAEDLLNVQDLAAETQLLRKVKVLRTKDPAIAPISPFSLHYINRSQHVQAAFYWVARLHLLRLCRHLAMAMTTPIGFTSEDMHTEMWRVGKNIVMSWEYLQNNGGILASTSTTGALIALWGCIQDLDDDNKLPKSKPLEDFLLSNSNMILQRSENLSEFEMDQAADLFAGGPLTGPFIDLYAGPG